MAVLDRVIVKVDDLDASVAFSTLYFNDPNRHLLEIRAYAV